MTTTSDLEINHTILRMIMRAYADSDKRQLNDLGVDESSLSMINQLSLRQADFIALQSRAFIKVKFDNLRFRSAIDYMNDEVEMSQLVDEAILLGAPFTMFEEIVGMTRLDFQRRRKMLNCGRRTGGRPSRLLPSEVEFVIAQLEVNKSTNCELTRYVNVAKATKISLHRIWAYCTEEFADDLDELQVISKMPQRQVSDVASQL